MIVSNMEEKSNTSHFDLEGLTIRMRPQKVCLMFFSNLNCGQSQQSMGSPECVIILLILIIISDKEICAHLL